MLKLRLLLNGIVRTLTSEHLVDALRNSIAVILPITILFYMQMPKMAIGIGTGALLICLTDLPGNRGDKFRSAWISVLTFGLTASLTAASLTNNYLTTLVLVVFTFLFTMFGVLGQRLSLVGLMAIALAIFTIGLKPEEPLVYGFYIFVGGIWYHFISLLQIYAFPYRSVNRAINETIRQTASLLLIRSKGYDPNQSLAGFNEKNMRMQLKLANQHELIRQLLLSDRRAMNISSVKGKILLAKALNLIDLYEQVSAVHYDYPHLRKQLAATRALPLIQKSIEMLAKKLLFARREKIYHSQYNEVSRALKNIAQNIPEIQSQLLQQIINNLEKINALIVGINTQAITLQVIDRYQDFLPSTGFPFKNLAQHFSLKSPVFRFSLRLSALCLFAMILISSFTTSHYSYWLLLTIVIVSRPSYGVTLRRNWERLGGTFFGIFLAYLIMLYANSQMQLLLAGVFLLGFFAFNRTAYAVSVVCITIAVLLCLNIYDGHTWEIVSGRLIFTLLGGLLCLAATFLFPIWNAPRIYHLIQSVLLANAQYFETVTQIKLGDSNSLHQSRLARKNSHQQLRELSDAVTAAKIEPFGKKLNWNLIKRIELLSHQFNALTAALAGANKNKLLVLEASQLEQIKANLETSISYARNTDLIKKTSMPTFGDQPMDLLEVSNRINQLLAN